MYLIYRNDGSFKFKIENEYVMQNANNINYINVSIDGRSTSDWNCTAFFTLPNGTNLSIAGVQKDFVYSGTPYKGYQILIPNTITAIAGQVNVSVQLYNSVGSQLWTYSGQFQVNGTVSPDDWETSMTEAEYQSFLLLLTNYINAYDEHLIRGYNSYNDALLDLARISLNEYILTKENNYYNIYQKQFVEGQYVLTEITGKDYKKAKEYIDEIIKTVKIVSVNNNFANGLLKSIISFENATPIQSNVVDLDDWYYNKGEMNTLLDGKVDKKTTATSYAQAYIKYSNGTQGNFDVDDQVIDSAIVRRDANGQVILPQTPTSPYHASSKKYVDDTKTQLQNMIIEYQPTYRGEFGTYALLIAYTGTKDKNDYAIVLADETHSNQTSRYVYNGSAWTYEYKISDTALTPSQLAALNSGVNSTKVGNYDTALTYLPSNVSASNKLSTASDLATKQDQLTAGSGITIENNVISATGSTSIAWGNITGSISNQTDLVNTFAAKQDLLTDLELPYGEITLTHDQTDGTIITGQGRINETDEINLTYTIPYIAGSGINMDANEDNDKVIISLDLPQASDNVLGGVKATSVASSTGLLDVKVDANGKLYCPTVPALSIEVVSQLPATGELGKIYLVPLQDGSGTQNYKEYIWTGSAFEELGAVSVDLSNYYTKAQTESLISTATQPLEQVANKDTSITPSASNSHYPSTLAVYNYAPSKTDLQQGLATKMTIGAVEGTHDGTNWTTITINGTTKIFQVEFYTKKLSKGETYGI